jgi:hypothetical protein
MTATGGYYRLVRIAHRVLRAAGDHYAPMVGDIFRGFGKKRGDPIEQLDRDALYARVGPPPEPPKQAAEVGPYLRPDGPRPAQPRTWRNGAEGPGR